MKAFASSARVAGVVRVAYAALFLAATFAAAACRGSSGAAQAFPSADVPAATEPRGAYEYTANLPGHQLKGVIAVLADTIILEAGTGLCKAVPETVNPRGVLYECFSVGRYDRVTFWIDRFSTQQWRWTATERVVRNRRVCGAYEVRGGQRVCIREENETYEVQVPHSGRLTVLPRGR